MDKYPEEIMKAVRQNLGLDENDISKDDIIMKMSKNEVFNRVCVWNGLINYGPYIRRWVMKVYNISFPEN